MNTRRYIVSRNAEHQFGVFSFSVPSVFRFCSLSVKSFVVLLSVLLFVSPLSAQRPEKDYLSSIEADKIRDAETTNDRIKLFLTFAEDRLTKFKYELDHPSSNKHTEMLNYLMNSYIGCVDDAADLVQLGLDKQENIRLSVDLMASKAPAFLATLKKYSENGPELEVYKDNLEDAIQGTEDALREAQNAKKKAAPPPVRRKN